MITRDPDNPLHAELLGEYAAALAESGRRLRTALDALRAHDALTCKGELPRSSRAELVARAGEVFWGYVVQRELLGLHDADYIAREYGVPEEVRRCMGPQLKRQI